MKIKKLLLTSAFAFDNSNGWKLTSDGGIELRDGNPVYIDSSGSERIVEVETISRLNKEAKNHREAKEAAEEKLKMYAGLDPVQAREAVELASKLDQKKLIDAGKVDELKQQITNQYQEKLSQQEKQIQSYVSELHNMKVKDVFKSSQFVRESVAVPQDMFEATFARNFKVEEDGSIGAYDNKGNRLYSKTAGEYASPEEALQLLVDMHPQKDSIIKADMKKGSGGSNGGNRVPGRKTMSRSEFDSLGAYEKATTASLVGKGEITLTD